jgi:hypothetical protein
VDEMEADGPIAVGKKTESGAEGDGGAGMVSTAVRAAALVAMRGAFRRCSECDIIELLAAMREPRIFDCALKVADVAVSQQRQHDGGGW